uniref:(northern house mosquito) hypothetical protein n=1 Tax=Culex pipiens TaxID=7175 RepID=A0A8D8A301_CULPI
MGVGGGGDSWDRNRTSKHTPSKQGTSSPQHCSGDTENEDARAAAATVVAARRSAAARASPAVRFRHSTWARSPFQPAGATSMRVFLRARVITQTADDAFL